MSCLHSDSYLVLLNGQPVGNIKPSRGLHQGDPLSPYLFLLCALGLQSLIQKVEGDEDNRGVFLWRNGPQVSHLFFANDSVLFSRAMEANATKLWRPWLSIREVQGKKNNRDKTNIFFSSNTQAHIQTRIQALLGVPAIH